MGYTRYYEITGKIDPEKFETYSNDCKIICDEITNRFGDKLAGWDGTELPEFTKDEVRFNGVGENSHETFTLCKDSTGFNFTKTQRKPYDRHVLACLILAKEYFGDNIRVSSDGDNNDIEIENIIKIFKRDSKICTILDI